MILGHNVEYTGSMSRLPILVLECSKGGHLEGGACQTGLKSGFLRGKTWMKWPEIFMGQSQPPGQSFPHGCIPRVLRRSVFREAAKRERRGDAFTYGKDCMGLWDQKYALFYARKS